MILAWSKGDFDDWSNFCDNQKLPYLSHVKLLHCLLLYRIERSLSLPLVWQEDEKPVMISSPVETVGNARTFAFFIAKLLRVFYIIEDALSFLQFN